MAGLLRSWPQMLHILKSEDVRGVSASTWLINVFVAVTWTSIGIVDHIPLTIVYNVTVGLGGLCVLGALAGRHAAKWSTVFSVGLVALVVNVVLYQLFGASGVGVLAVGSAVSSAIPQLVRVLRGAAAGVSALSWSFFVLSSICWAGYGLALGKWVLVAQAFFMTPASMFIAFRALRSGVARPTVVV